MKQATFGGSDGPGGADRAGRALAMAIDQRGTGLLFEPDKLKAVLSATVPDAMRAIDAIVAAVANQVPQSMLAAHSDEHLASVLPTLVERLLSTTPLDPAQASWIVRTWAKALALPTDGLDVAAPSPPASSAATVVDRRASLEEMLGPKPVPAQRVAAPLPATVEAAREPAAPPAVVEATLPPAADAEAKSIEPAATAPSEAIVAPKPYVPAAPTEPSSSPAARPVPIIDVTDLPARPVASTRRRSRLSIIAAIALAVVASIGFAVWRWKSAPEPVAATASDGDRVADASPSSGPPPAPSSIDTADKTGEAVGATPARDDASPASPVEPSPTAASPPAAPAIVVDERPMASPAAPVSRPPTRTLPALPGPLAGAVPARSTTSAAPALAPAPARSGEPASSLGCTLSSCGSVVAVHPTSEEGPASQGASARGYEMTIRMDDRSIRTLTQPRPLATGSRVRLEGNALVPIAR